MRNSAGAPVMTATVVRARLLAASVLTMKNYRLPDVQVVTKTQLHRNFSEDQKLQIVVRQASHERELRLGPSSPAEGERARGLWQQVVQQITRLLLLGQPFRELIKDLALDRVGIVAQKLAVDGHERGEGRDAQLGRELSRERRARGGDGLAQRRPLPGREEVVELGDAVGEVFRRGGPGNEELSKVETGLV